MKPTFKIQIKKPTLKLGEITRRLIVYFICAITAFIFLTQLGILSGLTYQYIVLTLGFFCLGIIHAWLITKYFEWDYALSQKSLFTLVMVTIALVILYLFLSNQNDTQVSVLNTMAAFAFCLPIFFQLAVEQILQIPSKVFKAFGIDTFDDVDRTITFEENKHGFIWILKTENELKTNDPIRLFAPSGFYQMPIKKLFKTSMLFYNVRYGGDEPIQIVEDLEDGENRSYQWYFLHRPFPFSPLKYIDPDKTVEQNGLKFYKIKKKVVEENEKKRKAKYVLSSKIYVVRK